MQWHKTAFEFVELEKRSVEVVSLSVLVSVCLLLSVPLMTINKFDGAFDGACNLKIFQRCLILKLQKQFGLIGY